MKSVKGVIIGFLLLLIGICLIQVQLIVATGVATSGLVTVVICALPKRLWEQEALRNAEREKQKQQAAAARIGEELDASVQQTAEQMHTAEETVPQASLEAAEAELLTADASELGQELSLDELLQQAQALIGGSPARLEQAAVRREPERAAGAAPAEPNIERSAKPEHVLRRQPKQPRGTRPGRAQLAAQLEQLGRAYTAIDAMTGGRGPAQAQQDIAACDAFRADWEAACSDEAFASLVQSKARYSDIEGHFRIPGFGVHGTVRARRTSAGGIADLSAGILRRTEQQRAALQAYVQAQTWFSHILPSLPRHAVQTDAHAQAAAGGSVASPELWLLTRHTPKAALEDFYALQLETTGSNPEKDDIRQIAIIRFYRFAPVEYLAVPVRAAHDRRADSSLPEAAQVMADVDAFIGEAVPLVAHQMERQYRFLAAAGSKNIVKQRALYDTQQQTKLQNAPLETLCERMFCFVPERGSAEQQALACGLVFCEQCDRKLGLTS